MAVIAGVGRDNSPGISGISDVGPAVGVIEINGTIMGGDSSGIFGDTSSGSQTIMSDLRAASENPDIKAVVLHINSPGGTVAASQEISDEVVRLKKKGIKVVTSMGDMAASGGYWVAAFSDRIVANPGTMTGSIGVIIQTINYQGLYDKLGLEGNTFKSGAYKDMGSPERPISTEETLIFQSMVDDTFQQFVDVVAKNRKMDPQAIRQLNGRVLTGRQALKAGLVDSLGNYYDAVSLAGELSGLGSNPRVVDFATKGPLSQIFGSLEGSALDKAVSSGLNQSGLPRVLLLCPVATPFQ
ncbi:MAG: signal peptide peptidase SppA [Peptococcaceae bacterium]|nr:signal peptide peptidase SppA [Peptococcaceae bacterium]